MAKSRIPRKRRPWPDRDLYIESCTSPAAGPRANLGAHLVLMHGFKPWGAYLRASSKRLGSLVCDRCEAWLRRQLEKLA